MPTCDLSEIGEGIDCGVMKSQIFRSDWEEGKKSRDETLIAASFRSSS